MTDRELLESAARAADLRHPYGWDWLTNPRGDKWNPLEDDGDALRLAVRLGLQVVLSGVHGLQAIEYQSGAYGEWERGDDPYAAARRAIVICAAEIGSTK